MPVALPDWRTPEVKGQETTVSRSPGSASKGYGTVEKPTGTTGLTGNADLYRGTKPRVPTSPRAADEAQGWTNTADTAVLPGYQAPTGLIVQRNREIHPHAAPLTLPGQPPFTPGFMRRVPQPGDTHDFRFHFLYNPFEIQVNTGLNVDTTYDSTDPGAYYFSGSQTVAWSTLINRMPDAHDIHAGRLIYEQAQGTLEDLEYLWRVINGKPEDLYGTSGGSTIVARTADKGFISSTPVEVHFTPNVQKRGISHGLRYVGVLQAVNVQHKTFNRDMVPLLTEVSFQLQRQSGIQPSALTEKQKAAAPAAPS